MENLDLPENSPEQQPIKPEDVVSALDGEGIESTEAYSLMCKYIDQCQAEADAEVKASKGDSIVANRANIKAAIKVAQVYLKTSRYRDFGIDSLNTTLSAALQSTNTDDMAGEIRELIAQMTKREVRSDKDGDMNLSV